MTLQAGAIRRLTNARHLLLIARDQTSVASDQSDVAALILVQDAIELFLVTAAEHLDAPVDARTQFDGLFDRVSDKMEGSLPLRAALLRLNKARVNAKHHGIQPAAKEVQDFYTIAEEFLSEVCLAIFGVEFSTLSLINLVNDSGQAALLYAAEASFHAEIYSDCLIECRKAFYLAFEKRYDIYAFKEFTGKRTFLTGPHSSAPHWAQTSKYIAESVTTPFDYIVVDHSSLDSYLLAYGISPQIYQNIKRLTPKVYLQGESWLIENELDILNHPDAKGHAGYVLPQTVDLILRKQSRDQSERFARTSTLWEVRPLRAGIPIFKKADQSSDVTPLPDGIDLLHASSGTPGLDGEFYWNVIHIKKGGPFVFGFALETDLELLFRAHPVPNLGFPTPPPQTPPHSPAPGPALRPRREMSAKPPSA